MEDIPHVPRDSTELRDAAHKAGSRAQDSVKAFKPASREPIVYGTTVVQTGDYEGMNQRRSSIWGEGAGYHPELPELVVTATAKEIDVLDKCKLLV